MKNYVTILLLSILFIGCNTTTVEFQNTEGAYGHIVDIKRNNPVAFKDVVNDTTFFIYDYNYNEMSMRVNRSIVYRKEGRKNIFIAEN